MAPSLFLSENFIFGVYVPSALTIFGVAIAAPDYLPYAVLAPLLLGSFQYVVSGESKGINLIWIRTTLTSVANSYLSSAVTKALKPQEFQEFRLENKKILSHNVTMQVPDIPNSFKGANVQKLPLQPPCPTAHPWPPNWPAHLSRCHDRGQRSYALLHTHLLRRRTRLL